MDYAKNSSFLFSGMEGLSTRISGNLSAKSRFDGPNSNERSRFESSITKSDRERSNVKLDNPKERSRFEAPTSRSHQSKDSHHTTVQSGKRSRFEAEEAGRAREAKSHVWVKTPQSFLSSHEDAEWNNLLERRRKCKQNLDIAKVRII